MVNQCDYIMDARGVAQKFKDEAARAMMRELQPKMDAYVQTCRQQWQHDITATRTSIEIEQ